MQDAAETTGHGLWYLVPAAPHGWAIFHCATGRRLEADDGRLRLTASMTGLTHWEVLRHGTTKSTHRSHFWLPGFLEQTLCNTPHRPDPMHVFEPVGSGSKVVALSGATAPSISNAGRGTCLAQCAADPSCGVVVVANDGTCLAYRGYAVDETTEADGVLAGGPLGPQWNLATLLVRERRLFGDSRVRSGTAPNSTREYTERWPAPGAIAAPGTVVFRRRERTEPVAAMYRRCLSALGMDSPVCLAFLQTHAPDQQYAMQQEALGQYPNQRVPGLCGPLDGEANMQPAAARLSSGVCGEFCSDHRTRQDGLCSTGYREYCAGQTALGGLHQKACGCYLAPETYRRIRAAANAQLTEGSPLLGRINTILEQKRVRDHCWYAPCQETAVGPADSTCPPNTLNACIQVAMNNSYVSGGGQQHEQSCVFSGGLDAVPAGDVERLAPSGRRAETFEGPATPTVSAPTYPLATPMIGEVEIVRTSDDGPYPALIIAAVALGGMLLLFLLYRYQQSRR